MSHNDDKERSILARIRQRKKKMRRVKEVRTKEREWFFFFFKVDWIRKIWNLNHRHEI